MPTGSYGPGEHEMKAKSVLAKGGKRLVRGERERETPGRGSTVEPAGFVGAVFLSPRARSAFQALALARRAHRELVVTTTDESRG